MTALLVLLLVLAGVWAVGLVLRPWRDCPRCKAAPKNYRSASSRVFRLCGRCGGTGRLLRWGAGRFRWGA